MNFVKSVTMPIALCFSTVMALFIPAQDASATYSDSDFYYYSTVSVPGTVSGPLVVGENVGVNGCSSTFMGYSLCQFSDLSAFTFEWTIWDSQNSYYGVIDSFSGANAANGLVTEFETGDGTFFQSAGTYYIGLDIFVDRDTYVGLPNGQSVYTRQYGARGFQWGDSFNIAEATPVPEPMGALLLAPALFWIARRERRAKKAIQP